MRLFLEFRLGVMALVATVLQVAMRNIDSRRQPWMQ